MWSMMELKRCTVIDIIIIIIINISVFYNHQACTQHTLHFNRYLPHQPGLTGCPVYLSFWMFASCWIRRNFFQLPANASLEVPTVELYLPALSHNAWMNWYLIVPCVQTIFSSTYWHKALEQTDGHQSKSQHGTDISDDRATTNLKYMNITGSSRLFFLQCVNDGLLCPWLRKVFIQLNLAQQSTAQKSPLLASTQINNNSVSVCTMKT